MKKLILVLACALSTCFAAERYMCEFEISQSSVTLDVWQHIKDSSNKFTITIPVDKEFYDSVHKGQKLTSKKKTANFFIDGSIKKVNVFVKDKWISRE